MKPSYMSQYGYIWNLMSSEQKPAGEGLGLYHTIYIKVKMTKYIMLYIRTVFFKLFWGHSAL